MEKQNFTRQEVLDIITEIDDKGIDIESITYVQILDTIVNKLGQDKQLDLCSVGKQSELLLKKQADWLMTSTTLSTEAIVLFEETFK